ncbi:MAG: penicillin-binding protein 2, partial [Clostridia bacterium]|nr:penicillin-binding protein 2 [Clostridia bacterium]
VFIALFLMLIGYLLYFLTFQGEQIINNTYNTRQELFEKKVVRGSILSRDHQILAQTVVTPDQTEKRVYPFNNLFAQVVGYSTHGNIGIEQMKNFSLLHSNVYIGEWIDHTIHDEKNIGDHIVSTLDVALQQAAYDALGAYKGAVIAMDPATGEILAMVSKPDFDPNLINEQWDQLQLESEDSPLINRATQGLYPGGSTFKIITAYAYLKQHQNQFQDYSYTCNGILKDGENEIHCYHNTKHGQVNFIDSFAQSCNTSFANIGISLERSKFQTTCDELLFNQALPIDLPSNKSFVPIDQTSTNEDVIQAAIGQGKTLVTPMHIALITSAIANDGILMKPYLIQKIESYKGDEVESFSSKEYKELMTKEESAIMQELMYEVVRTGTGKKLNEASYTVGGKTGSAEYSNQTKDSHAWFTGFAADGNKNIVVTVVVEGAGSGSEYAVPIAKRVFDSYFN